MNSTTSSPLHFTPQEKRILDYLHQHPQAIANHSAEQLAQLTWTSAATLNRLGRKLGYKGFADFKLNAVADLKNRCLDCDSFLENFAVPEMTPEAFSQTLRNTIDQQNSRLLQACAENFRLSLDALRQTNNIDIYATGNNLPYAHIAARKLSTTGKTVQTFHYVEDDHINNITADNLSIILSRTGNNPLCLYAADLLLQMNQTVIAITGSHPSPLSLRCPLVLPFWYKSTPHPLARLIEADSLNYLFNALWFGLIQKMP
ncbi:MurR/RpiR family transcriptional regulator [Superficieibacter electus]|nr:MurR/RpiR family transcriptional regulator [Superficieibacter electus]